jgi:hypothetical protein
MIRRTFLFFIGFLVGYIFDLIPSIFEIVASTNVCVESCSSLLKGASLAVYVILPIAWGGLFAAGIGKTNGKRILLISLLVSLTVMVLLTWFLYKHQHP